MMAFVNMDSDGLAISPTHRVVFGLKGFAASSFLERAGAYFDIERLGPEADEITRRLAEEGAEQTAFVAVTGVGNYILKAKEAAVEEALRSVPERLRKLDISRLHCLVLEKLLGITPEAIREQANLRYLRDAPEAMEQVADGRANAAFLVNPATLGQLREVAFAGELMPPRSTEFYPKLLSGLAIYALD